MSNQSIIEHRANMYYVEFREEYLTIALACTYKKPTGKSKASPYCKALILAIAEGWTNNKRGCKDLTFYMTYEQWIESMYGMFSRSVIIDSVSELVGETLLSREIFRVGGKDTFRYLFNHVEVNTRLKSLEAREPDVTRPLVDAETGIKVDGYKSRRETGIKVDADGYKSRRNIESTQHLSTDHKERECSDTLTLPQPEITPTLPAVASDYTTSPTIDTDGQPSMQLSTASRQNVDKSHNENGSHSQQSYSHRQDTSPATHVGVMTVFEVPVPPGVKIPDAPQVQAPPMPPKTVQDQPSDEARAIRRMYDRCAGYVTGHAEWEWKKMEEMARDLGEAGALPTKDDMQLVYDHLKATKQKHTIVHVWEAWEQLPTLKAKQVQTSTAPNGVYMPPESDLVRRMREMRESVEKKQVAR